MENWFLKNVGIKMVTKETVTKWNASGSNWGWIDFIGETEKQKSPIHRMIYRAFEVQNCHKLTIHFCKCRYCWYSFGLITRRSWVRILPPLQKPKRSRKRPFLVYGGKGWEPSLSRSPDGIGPETGEIGFSRWGNPTPATLEKPWLPVGKLRLFLLRFQRI